LIKEVIHLKKQFRQGDILLREIEEVPTGDLEIVDDGVLALGETTGHSHQVQMSKGVQLLRDPKTKIMFIVATTIAIVTHEDHGTLKLPAGAYQVTQQRQRGYAPRTVRQIQD